MCGRLENFVISEKIALLRIPLRKKLMLGEVFYYARNELSFKVVLAILVLEKNRKDNTNELHPKAFPCKKSI